MGLGAQLAAKRQQTRRIISVAEWGDDDQPLQIYASALTCQEFDRIQKKHKDFLSSQSIEGMVDLIILKAENGDGDRLFTLEDKPHLMREPLSVVTRVAAEMMGSVTSIEDHEKN